MAKNMSKNTAKNTSENTSEKAKKILDKTRISFRPFDYPFAMEACKMQQRMYWVPEEFATDSDIYDWRHRLSAEEIDFLNNLLRFFTQSDLEVANAYIDQYWPMFKLPELRFMFLTFGQMETVHTRAYDLIANALHLPDSDSSVFLEYEEMRAKYEHMMEFKSDSVQGVIRTMAMFAGFTEGLQLFSSFVMFLHFQRLQKMKTLSQIIALSMRDETLHTTSMLRLLRCLRRDYPEDFHAVRHEIADCCVKVVENEDAFIDKAFEMSNGVLKGDKPNTDLHATDIKEYIRYTASLRIQDMNILDPEDGIIASEHSKQYLPPELAVPNPYAKYVIDPLPWVYKFAGLEFVNFFENMPTEYSHGALKGDWQSSEKEYDPSIEGVSKRMLS